MDTDIDVYIDEKIFDFIFIEAMGDATLRGAYGGDKSKIVNISKLQDLKKAISSFVENVFNGLFLD